MSEQPTLRVGRAAVEAARAEVDALEAAGKGSEVDPLVRRIAEAQVATPASVPPTAEVGKPAVTVAVDGPSPNTRVYFRDAKTGAMYSARSTAGRRLKRLFKAPAATVQETEVHNGIIAVVVTNKPQADQVVKPRLAVPRPKTRQGMDRAAPTFKL